MRKLWSCLFILISIISFAQVKENEKKRDNISEQSSNVIALDDDEIEKLWVNSLFDTEEYNQNYYDYKSKCDANTIAQWNSVGTEQLKSRLLQINQKHNLSIKYTSELEATIKDHLRLRRKKYTKMLSKAQYYFPMIEAQFAVYNIPSFLKYLTILESNLNPKALSKSGAAGMWQFMAQTGSTLKLKNNRYIDERQDPLKSTIAAATYLSKLYQTFNDWDLAIAAYNAGAGNVKKAIEKAGTIQINSVVKHLPNSHFVEEFYAILYVFEYADEHHIKPIINMERKFETEEITINRPISLKQIQTALGVDNELFTFLNPAYKSDLIPANDDLSYTITLPKKDAIQYKQILSGLYTNEQIKSEIQLASQVILKTPILSNITEYKVVQGDNLYNIASKNHVLVTDLMKWNQLEDHKLHINQILKIYNKEVQNLSENKKIYHEIVSGDNLWAISKKYNVSVEAIKSWNNLTISESMLSLGTKLIIYVN